MIRRRQRQGWARTRSFRRAPRCGAVRCGCSTARHGAAQLPERRCPAVPASRRPPPPASGRPLAALRAPRTRKCPAAPLGPAAGSGALGRAVLGRPAVVSHRYRLQKQTLHVFLRGALTVQKAFSLFILEAKHFFFNSQGIHANHSAASRLSLAEPSPAFPGAELSYLPLHIHSPSRSLREFHRPSLCF